MVALWTRISQSDGCRALSPRLDPVSQRALCFLTSQSWPSHLLRPHEGPGTMTSEAWTEITQGVPTTPHLILTNLGEAALTAFFYKQKVRGLGKGTTARRAEPGFHLDGSDSKGHPLPPFFFKLHGSQPRLSAAFKPSIPRPLDQVNGDRVEHLLPLKVTQGI